MKTYTVEAISRTRMIAHVQARTKEEALIKAETELVVWTTDDSTPVIEVRRAR